MPTLCCTVHIAGSLLRFARILSSVVVLFFLTGNMPIKQKACTFFINFFHIKLGFVCHAASIEDVSSLGSIVCFLILTTFLFCFCL